MGVGDGMGAAGGSGEGQRVTAGTRSRGDAAVFQHQPSRPLARGGRCERIFRNIETPHHAHSTVEITPLLRKRTYRADAKALTPKSGRPAL